MPFKRIIRPSAAARIDLSGPPDPASLASLDIAGGGVIELAGASAGRGEARSPQRAIGARRRAWRRMGDYPDRFLIDRQGRTGVYLGGCARKSADIGARGNTAVILARYYKDGTDGARVAREMRGRLALCE